MRCCRDRPYASCRPNTPCAPRRGRWRSRSTASCTRYWPGASSPTGSSGTSAPIRRGTSPSAPATGWNGLPRCATGSTTSGRLRRRRSRSRSDLLAERLSVFELYHDELGRRGADVLGKMDVAVAAPERSRGNRGRLGGAVGNREVERLIGQEDHAPGEMAVHHRPLARAVADAQKPRDVVLERYRVVFGVRRHRVGKRVGPSLHQRRGRGDAEDGTHRYAEEQIPHVHHPLIAPAATERRAYFNAFTAACATTPSCWLVPPDAPIAPTIFPPDTSGIPPSTGMAPSRARIRSPSPPAASAS